MTAHALKGDEERCLASGMDGYITKPIRAPLLFAQLSQICDSATCKAPLSSTSTVTSTTGAGAVVFDRRANKPADPRVNTDERADELGLIDWAVALHIVGGDELLLGEIASAVLVECPDQFRQLDAAIAAADAKTARRAAHTILGNLRAIGSARPMQLAVQLEDFAKTGQLADMSEPLEALRQLVDRVYVELREFLARE